MDEGASLARDFRTLFDSGTTGGLTDSQLLDRFEDRREQAEAAFEGIITRHGPMVLGICRRVLRDRNEVDDAFQATFLVLASRVGSIRNREALGGWLARVALRVALRAQGEAGRRHAFERRAAVDEARAASDPTALEEARAAVDEEVDRLPDRFRRPVVLCYLEGLTHDEAARRLRCPVGTVRSRLSRARDRLRDRLTRRGLAPFDLAPLAPWAPPISLIKAAALASTRPLAASPSALLLKKGILMSMTWDRLRQTGLLLMACGSTAGALAFAALPRPEDPPKQAAPKATERVVEGVVLSPDRTPVQGARVFFAQADRGMTYREGAIASTDGRGHYRIDLARSPWLTGKVRAMLLAPGFRAAERTFEAGQGVLSADFELVTSPWKGTEVFLVDPAGKPIEGVPIVAMMGQATWASSKTDARGSCLFLTPPSVPIQLAIKPEGARPITTYLGASADEPASVTLTVLPPFRGVVVDAEGRPSPGVLIGYGIHTGPDGKARMTGLPGEPPKTTGVDGAFAIAPGFSSRTPADLVAETKRARPLMLCFADPTFRRVAYRLIDGNRAIEPMTVILRPTRKVRVPVVGGLVASHPGSRIGSSLTPVAGADRPGPLKTLISRELIRKEPTGPIPFEADVPDGTYQLEVSMSDPKMPQKIIGSAKRELKVPEGEGPIDFPPIELEAAGVDRFTGKPAPEIDATDLETGRAVKLADFRGRVVVLDLWGSWTPTSNLIMPHLMDLHRKFEGRPLTILALHDQSIGSRAEYDRKIATIRERFWGSRDLPFPVLLDRPDPDKPAGASPDGYGMTFQRYGGRRAIASLLVIDPDGTVAAPIWFTEHDQLEALVRKLVEKAEAARKPGPPK